MLLGFSTGAIFRKVPSISKEIIDICREIGCNAIEVSVKTGNEVKLLEGFVNSGESLADFDYISMHSPDIGVTYENDFETMKLLEKLHQAHHHFGCKNLVIHPDAVKNWNVFEKFSFNLAIENMSKDITPLYLPEQLEDIFKNEKYSMTFDVKHAFESGGEKLAEDLYIAFKERIGEIHLSGFFSQATKHAHPPLVETKQEEIVNFVKDKQHLPIIIESDCRDVAQMKKEYEYVKNLLVS